MHLINTVQSLGFPPTFLHLWAVSAGQLPLSILVLVYFYTRYFFASAMAHISAMYLAFVAAAIAVGTPPIIAAIGLGYTSTLSMSLTQYAGGPGPALYGSGYNSTGQWWGVSFIVSILSLVIWFGVGGLWMKLLGWW